MQACQAALGDWPLFQLWNSEQSFWVGARAGGVVGRQALPATRLTCQNNCSAGITAAGRSCFHFGLVMVLFVCSVSCNVCMRGMSADHLFAKRDEAHATKQKLTSIYKFLVEPIKASIVGNRCLWSQTYMADTMAILFSAAVLYNL